jgi:hypothetical protein
MKSTKSRWHAFTKAKIIKWFKIERSLNVLRLKSMPSTDPLCLVSCLWGIRAKAQVSKCVENGHNGFIIPGVLHCVMVFMWICRMAWELDFKEDSPLPQQTQHQKTNFGIFLKGKGSHKGCSFSLKPTTSSKWLWSFATKNCQHWSCSGWSGYHRNEPMGLGFRV